MFNNGYVRKDIFLNFINENGADWADTQVDKENGIVTHIYFACDRSCRVFMPMLIDEDEIPKDTALNWLAKLKTRKAQVGA